MIPIRLVLVQFLRGSRGDFVAGWLGKLPSFIESHWSFNPMTGQTVSTNQHNVFLDRETGLNEFLESNRYVLDPNSSIFYPAGVKNISSYYDNILTPDVAKILRISVTDMNFVNYRWESCIKIYGRVNLDEQGKWAWVIDGEIKKDTITNIDRIEQLHNVLCRPRNKVVTTEEKFLTSGIEYNSLFVPGGSYILTNALGIKVNKTYHDYWDRMLPFAITPDEVEIWGHVFRKKDYFTD